MLPPIEGSLWKQESVTPWTLEGFYFDKKAKNIDNYYTVPVKGILMFLGKVNLEEILAEYSDDPKSSEYIFKNVNTHWPWVYEFLTAEGKTLVLFIREFETELIPAGPTKS